MRAGAGRLVKATPGALRPPSGPAPGPAASGALRHRAYAIPEHHARRWMLLMVADRLELVERRLAGRAGWLAVTAALLGAAGLAVGLGRRWR